MIINATKGKDLNIQNGTGEGSIVEGSPIEGTYSLPEATGVNSHGEGVWSDATGDYSHAEGSGATASGWAAHAEGYNTTSSGRASHVEGYFTIANHAYQHVFGAFNIGDPSTAANTEKGTYIEIVGNGNSTSQVNRSNARTLDWEGNEMLSGSLTTKSTIIDASKANNNVSTTLYPSTFDIRDSANRIISRQEAVVESSGDISGYWYVRNYNTSGEQITQKGILMRLNKSGIMTYDVSNPTNFCSAIGAIGASGGTITGQITKAGISTSWHHGRDYAALRMTSISGYSPCISVKTTNGTWEMGAYDYSTHTDRLIFTYITDSNYNSNNNAVTGQVQFLGGGHVVANYYYGNGSQLTGLTKSQITNWEDRFTCTQVWNNSSPTSNFGSQTIYLTSYGYTLYLMKVRNSTSNDNYSYQIINADSQLVKICNAGYYGNAIRTVSAASNYMNIGNAQHGSSSTNNAYCIPTTIWGLS